MKQIVRIYVIFALCAAGAITLPAQTYTTLHNFHITDGLEPSVGWFRLPMGTSTGQRL